jgi:hypothetical protein
MMLMNESKISYVVLIDLKKFAENCQRHLLSSLGGYYFANLLSGTWHVMALWRISGC